MTKQEFENWQEVTAQSKYAWQSDPIRKLNGNGALFYTGGEDGCYMSIDPTGLLMIGTYEGAVPHIGEACFRVKAKKQYPSYNDALSKATEIGGIKFLTDIVLSGGL